MIPVLMPDIPTLVNTWAERETRSDIVVPPHFERSKSEKGRPGPSAALTFDMTPPVLVGHLS